MKAKEARTANSRFAKAGVSCFYDSEVLNSSFVHLMKFSAKNPRLRKAAKRQAVKKPFFHLNFPYFPIATTQIEPFKKAVFFRLHI